MVLQISNFTPLLEQTGSGVPACFLVWQACILRLSSIGPVEYVCFQDGGSYLEVVFGCTFLCKLLCLLSELNSPSLVQRGSIKELYDR